MTDERDKWLQEHGLKALKDLLLDGQSNVDNLVLQWNEEDDDELSFLLVGGTGSGKSATANTILDSQAFKSQGGHASVTRTYHSHRAVVNGQRIHAVDTPGFSDTEMKTESERRNLVIDEITLALIQLPKGFHVVVPVTAYNERLPEEANKTMMTMIKLLDSEAFESNGIAVISNGDAFKRDYRNGNIDEEFKTHLKNLPKKYEWIKNSCSERCVLFNNITEDTDEKERQRKNLMQYVKSLKAKERYIPSICRWSSSEQKTALISTLKVMNYERVFQSIESLLEKLQNADKPCSSIELEEDARKILRMLSDTNDKNASLQLFIEKIESLASSDKIVPAKTREKLTEIIKESLKITSISFKASWIFQRMKRRVAEFFRNSWNYCEIV